MIYKDGVVPIPEDQVSRQRGLILGQDRTSTTTVGPSNGPWRLQELYKQAIILNKQPKE